MTDNSPTVVQVTPLPKSGKKEAVARRPLPRRSRKRLGDHIAYMRMRREVEARANGRCEARVEGVCLGRGDAAHHILPRSAGGKDDTGNLLWVCNAGCHAWIHAHPVTAREFGLLRGRYEP